MKSDKVLLKNLLVILGLILGLLYIFYLYHPLKDQEFKFFVNLPSALLGFLKYVLANYEQFSWCFLFAFAGLGLGELILSVLFKLNLPSGIKFGLGLGGIGLITFYLGFLTGLYIFLIKILIIILSSIGFIYLFKIIRNTNFDILLICEIFIILIFSVFLAFSLIHPTYFYDALSYHLALPKQYLLKNSFTPILSIAYSFFPQLAEMLYFIGLVISEQVGAQMVNLLFWLANILIARELGKELFNTNKSIYFSFLLLCFPGFNYMGHLITNDIILAFFIISGIYVLLTEKINLKTKSVIWGIIVGLGCSVKLTAYLFLFIPQLIIFTYLIYEKNKKIIWQRLFISFIFLVLISSGFWARNAYYTKNPFYPALSSILGGWLTSYQSYAIWLDAHGIDYKSKSNFIKEIFKFSPDYYYLPISTQNSAKHRAIPFLGTIIFSGLALLFAFSWSRKIKLLLGYFLITYFIWVFSLRWNRFILGAWIVLSVLSGGGYLYGIKKSKIKNFFKTILFLSIGISLCLEILTGARETRWKLFLENISPELYLLKHSSSRPVELGAYPAFIWLNHNSKPKDKVILLGTTSFFYLNRVVIVSSFIDWHPLIIQFNLNYSAEQIIENLKKDGVKYIIFQPAEFNRLSRRYQVNLLTPQGAKRMKEFFASPSLKLIKIFSHPIVYLYEID